MSKFWEKYPDVERELEIVKGIMLKNVKCSEKNIETALEELINSSGKMLRPAFLLLSSKFGEINSEKIYNLGALVEMLHMATLIHDDIIDDAPIRRGNETTQSKYGKNYAVFMGDFLFSKCFMLVSDGTSVKNLKMVSKVIARICIGEIEQFSHKFSRNVSINKYLKRIAAKTAALFSLSLYIGASESGCSEKFCKNIGKAGYNLGMAFQIIDDILDFNSNELIIGKPVGNDLKEGIYTLPLIYTLQKDNKALLELLVKESYSDDDIDKIIEYVNNSGGIDMSRDLAKKYTEKAFKQLSSLPESNSKKVLMEVTEKLLVRKY